MRGKYFVQRLTSTRWGVKRENIRNPDGAVRLWDDYVECSQFCWNLNRSHGQPTNVRYQHYDAPPHFILIPEKEPANV